MDTLIATVTGLFHEYAYLGIGMVGFSLLVLVISLLAMPYFVAAIPDDYFAHEPGPGGIREYLSVGAILTLTIKNIFGFIFIFAGIAMLVLPGQGLLTLFVGLMLADFPGKRWLVRKVIAIPPVLKTINRFRRNRGKAEFVLE